PSFTFTAPPPLPLRSRPAKGRPPLRPASLPLLAQGAVPCGLIAIGRPCKGASRGHARLPLARASFAVKPQQEHVERFYTIKSHHTQFKTNLSYENLGSDTTVGKPTAGRSYIPVFQIWMEKIKEVKRHPL
ncbi:hypothetical protein BHE74_00057949, partial [Ensete ventricosum]